MVRRRPGPVDRVRGRLRDAGLGRIAASLPDGYQRVGGVLIVRLSERLRPHYPEIGEAYQEELSVDSVLVPVGPVAGEVRHPNFAKIAGGSTIAEVVEHGIRYRLDAAEVLFSRGNKSERARAGTLTQAGETVVDLFAGIGYFVLPALVHGNAARVHAVELNPVSFRYLEDNLELNHVRARAVTYLGDNRRVALPDGIADRVFLGYLPNALPWVPIACRLLRPGGGTLHVHSVTDVHDGLTGLKSEVQALVRSAGRRALGATARRVKPFGPGRNHLVVDAGVGAPQTAAAPDPG